MENFKMGDEIKLKGFLSPKLIIKEVLDNNELSCMYVDKNDVIHNIILLKDVVELFDDGREVQVLTIN